MASISPGRVSVRVHLNAYIDSGIGRVDTNDAVEYVLDQLDEDERLALLEETLTRYVQDELRQIAAERRRAGTGYGYANGFLTEEKLQAGAAAIVKKMLEHVGEMIRVPVGQMTRFDLEAAIDYRQAQAAGHQRWIRFEKELLSRMPEDDPTATVEEVIPDPELLLIYYSFFPKGGASA